jgi:hypothetical protein
VVPVDGVTVVVIFDAVTVGILDDVDPGVVTDVVPIISNKYKWKKNQIFRNRVKLIPPQFPQDFLQYTPTNTPLIEAPLVQIPLPELVMWAVQTLGFVSTQVPVVVAGVAVDVPDVVVFDVPDVVASVVLAEDVVTFDVAPVDTVVTDDVDVPILYLFIK